MQVKLLRVIQDSQYERLGSNTVRQCNIRFITATNKNLEKMIEAKQFREDLYYRINTIELTLPALSERMDDIEYLAKHFLKKLNHIYNKNYDLQEADILKLKAYSWPGNIRQLEHQLERSVLLSRDKLELQIPQVLKANDSIVHNYLEIKEKDEIMKVLKDNNFNISHAAKKLGISRNALYRRIEKYQIQII
jgi:transcriptional regulator with PAS, ATPase and Fis domain